MDFGQVLHALKNGQKVEREGWNGKDMFVYHVPAASYPAQRNEKGTMLGLFPDDMVPYRAYLAMKTAQGDVVPWVASQSDLLAEDWREVGSGIRNTLNAGLREETFMDRLIKERDELAEKLQGLRKFLDSGGTANVSAFQSTKLQQQAEAMEDYLIILNKRIEDLLSAEAVKSISEIDEPVEIGNHDIDRDGPIPFQ